MMRKAVAEYENTLREAETQNNHGGVVVGGGVILTSVIGTALPSLKITLQPSLTVSQAGAVTSCANVLFNGSLYTLIQKDPSAKRSPMATYMSRNITNTHREDNY